MTLLFPLPPRHTTPEAFQQGHRATWVHHAQADDNPYIDTDLLKACLWWDGQLAAIDERSLGQPCPYQTDVTC